jgi:hypothetical protein
MLAVRVFPTLEFSHYAVVPGTVADEVIAERKCATISTMRNGISAAVLVGMILLAVPLLANATSTRTLSRGSRGSDVAALQRFLTGGLLLCGADDCEGASLANVPSFAHDAGDRINYPTRYTNVFDMVNMLPGTRTAVSVTGTSDVGAIASSNATAAGIIVYNYNFNFGTNPYFTSSAVDQSKNETVNVTFSNLPFNGPVTIKRYVIDQNTSNVEKFIDAGTTPTQEGSALQMTEQYSGTVTNGALVLPAQQAMTPSSVSLWMVTAQ